MFPQAQRCKYHQHVIIAGRPAVIVDKNWIKMINLLSILSPLSRQLKERSVLYRVFHAYLYAVKDIMFSKQTYSQWREDKIIYDILKINGGIQKDWLYIDVGANHPTTISDTYLFYRMGYRGICIEPIPELCRVYRVIRSRDMVFNAAAGDKHGILKFDQTVNSVFSSLAKEQLEDKVAKSYLVTLIRLDDLLPIIPENRIFLLKIDTEGFDQNVLLGGIKILKNTMVVLTETHDARERKERQEILGDDFYLVYTGANSIFVNSKYISNTKVFLK